MKRLCQVIGIARSSFYHWKATAADRAARAAADSRLEARIRGIHRESGGTYGVPRITAELCEDGQVVNHKRVARVMRGSGLAGLRLRRRHRTTVADPAAAKAPDLLQRDFTAPEPNTRYVGDITYLPIADGTFRYLATVMDLCSRRLAGWAIADHMCTELVIDALHAAERARGSLAGTVFHSDHGAQAILLPRVRPGLPSGRRDPVDGRDRQLGGQRRRGEPERVVQARDPAGCRKLVHRKGSTTGGVRLAAPLQHPAPSFPPRATVPDRLREQSRLNIGYTSRSRITPCPTSGGKPPSAIRPPLTPGSARRFVYPSAPSDQPGNAAWPACAATPPSPRLSLQTLHRSSGNVT